MIGIYKIENKLTGDYYVGSSKQVKKRWNRHKKDLEGNKHHSLILQRAWNKYGEYCFTFYVVEQCSAENLLNIEQKYLNLKPKYNIGVQASGGDNISQHPDRNTIVEKIKKTNQNRFSNLSKEERSHIYGKQKEENGNWKGGRTFCKCGTRINSSTSSCIKCTDRSGKSNPFYGKKHTKANIEKFREYAKARPKPGNTKKVECEGIIYESGNEAATQIGISRSLLNYRIKSKKYDYKWI